MAFEELIVSGGGTNYPALLGVLACMEDQGVLKGITRFYGTSVGAVLVFLLVIGYRPQQIFHVTLQYDFAALIDITSDDLLSIFENLGMTTGHKIIHIVNIFMKHKNIPSDVTFAQLRKLFPERALHITTWCVDDQETVLFSHETHPHVNVLTTLHMSISVPILFRPVAFQEKLYVDGGLYDNLPVSFCKTPEKAVCVTLKSMTGSTRNMDLIAYLHLLMRSMVGKITSMKLQQSSVQNIICVGIPYSTVVNTAITNTKKRYLYDLGDAEATRFLSSHKNKIHEKRSHQQADSHIDKAILLGQDCE